MTASAGRRFLQQCRVLSRRRLVYRNPQFLEALDNKPSGRLLPGKAQRSPIRVHRLTCFSQPLTEIGARRMREIVILKFTTSPNLIDQSQPSRRTIRHGDRNRMVQLDHRGRSYLQQEVVEPNDLRPTVSAAVRASECTSAIAACNVYGRRPRPGRIYFPNFPPQPEVSSNGGWRSHPGPAQGL